ncbi:MAG TPA: dienelactone hydrolase family protein [Planctomycetota bacterium]|nr:dienelactone hydrolase family protein [Planctomycetota bacterium]
MLRGAIPGSGLRGVVAAFLAVAFVACAQPQSKMEVESMRLEYRHGDAVLEGYLAFPKGKEPRPGVLVVHEWMGPGKHVWNSADRLAAIGYVALAVDIYGKDLRPKNAQEAAQAAGRFRGGDRALLRDRLQAGLAALLGTGRVDPSRVGAIGYCFGGSAVLELARSGAAVKGVVSFHGGLASGQGKSVDKIAARVLALHGADDPFVKSEEVAAFQEEMRRAGADLQFVAYAGAVHSFTNPEAGTDNSKGAAFNADADRRSWDAMSEFLKRTLR